MEKLVGCIVLALSAGISLAEESPIDAALAKGSKYLLAAQSQEGFWSDRQMPALTALPVWALSGVANAPADAIERGVKFVLGTQREDGGFYS